MYCFLNCVYVDTDDNVQYYEVIKCDKSFSEIQIERVSLAELELLSSLQEYVTDFSFEGDYLKCAPVKRVPCDISIEKSAKTHRILKEEFNKEKNLYTLLHEGVVGGFKFIADELIGLTKYKGTGVVPFSHVKFSQSSMSVYYREVVNGVGKNHYLISTEANSIKFRPFYFLVPAERTESIPYDRKGAMVVNNIEYSVYYSGSLGIVEPVKINSPALTNQANSERVRQASAVKATDFVLDSIYHDDEFAWDDSNRSSHNIHTIKFTASQKVLSKKSVESLYQKVIDGEKKDGLSYPATMVFVWFSWLLQHAKSETEIIAAAKQFKESFSERLFFADLYLYRIRVFVCYSKRINMPLNHPLYGGANGGFTVIEEVDQ